MRLPASLSLNTGLRLLLLALMEGSWLTGLVYLASALSQTNNNWLLDGTGVTAIWLCAAVSSYVAASWRQQLGIALGGLATVAAVYVALWLRDGDPSLPSIFRSGSLNTLFLVLPVLLLIVVRGVMTGQAASYDRDELTTSGLFSRFRVGFFALVVVTLAGLAGESLLSKRFAAEILPLIVNFLFFALINLAWGNYEGSRHSAGRNGGGQPQWGSWLIGGATIGLVALLGALISNSSPVVSALNFIAAVLFQGWFLLAGLVGGVVAFVLSLFIKPVPPPLVSVQPIPTPSGPVAGTPVAAAPAVEQTPFMRPEDIKGSDIVPVVIFLVLLAIVLWLVVLWLRNRRRGRRRTEDAGGALTRSGFGSWQLFFAQLREWLAWLWKWLLQRLGLWQEPITPDELAMLARNPAARTTVSVRQAYRAFLRAAAQAGHSRPPHATPAEYLTLLTRLERLPQGAATLTSLYTATRYGSLRPSETQVAAARAALRQLEDYFRRLPRATEGVMLTDSNAVPRSATDYRRQLFDKKVGQAAADALRRRQ